MTFPRPSNVGFYAVAKSHRGAVVLAIGPLDAAEAHARVDDLRPYAPSFSTYGVIRLVVPPDKPLPVYDSTATQPERTAA